MTDDQQKIEMTIARKIASNNLNFKDKELEAKIRHEIQLSNYLNEQEEQKTHAVKRIIKNINFVINFENKQKNNLTKNTTDQKSVSEKIIPSVSFDQVSAANKEILNSVNPLIDKKQSESQIMFIECQNCNTIYYRKKWAIRYIIVILLLVFQFLGLFGILFYLATTNPYICARCGERKGLIKILNNKKKVPINSMSTQNFLITWGVVFVLGIALLSLIQTVTNIPIISTP